LTFYYPRQIRFHETDGAGVVYFANVLTLCHEAYEASLAAAGMDLAEFFSPRGWVVPVVHGRVDFLRPMVCGDRLTIALSPSPLPKADRPLSEFEIHYRLLASADPLSADQAEIQAQAQTRHVCINAETRRRQVLPEGLQAWLAQWSAADRTPA
jgi:1,4-dihydroxy-2-naphthoyl-CoA hydrolase